MDDIPKLYGNDKDKIEEWIYLVETEAEDQGIDKNRLVTAVNKFLREDALQLVRNLKKKKENLTWQIANIIDKIDEFELVWMFFDAVDPRVRAELESKNVKTLDDAITQARIFSWSTWSVNKLVPAYYSRNNYKKRLKSFYNLREKEVDRGKNLNNKTDDRAEETEEPESNNRNRDTEYVYVCTTGNLLRINGLVDGKPVKFAIDSGCTSSIISRKTVNNFGLRILPSSSKIKTADITISMVVGKTKDNDELLGLDWFMQIGASLNPSLKIDKISERCNLDELG
ncbi:hypothetical protein BpHYR1_023289 [Brachionus plicatilis]|uniref:Peptidase A2 domain-containing protein n=1 Tax=Brachionus plicatilis TaxID=10195 RepID=A0A3M7QRM1_BRAPC|nr:hypothetical protein BpHYR1_023289 [Brachionus plicatilis]